MHRILTLILTMTTCLNSVSAQNTTTSPTINPDNSVTFSIYAPEADEVVIKGSFIPKRNLFRTDAISMNRDGKIKMVKEGDRWTYTTSPLASELYTYRFEIDEKSVRDSLNSNTIRNVADTLNYFVVRGGIADDYVTRRVAHGTVRKVWYPTQLDGMEKRRMTIYLPAEYSTNRTRRFPVLYLLHGSGGDEDSWEEVGRAIQILDNLIADGRCQPMIVVMPNGNAELAAAPGKDPMHLDIKPSANNTKSMFGKIESAFIPDIVKYVDSNYRSIPDKKHRAIAGLSLGGLHTLFIALNNPDEFDYIGLFSAQTTNALNGKRIGGMQSIGKKWDKLKENLPFLGGSGLDKTITKYTSDQLSIYDDVDNKLNRLFSARPRLFYIAVGKDDFVKKLNDDLRKKLDASHHPYHYNETDGGHTWDNWRKYLVDLLPRIFQ